MSLAFLQPDGGPVAQSPLAHAAEAAGARLAVRDGWKVAAGYGDPVGELRACRESVGWADASPLGKLEVHGAGKRLEAAAAGCPEDARWCPVTPERALVLCEPCRSAAVRERLERSGSVVDVTASLAGLRLIGPLAREAIARFCALDLRPAVLSVGGFRPGSVARTPGYVVHEGPVRFLMLFGAAFAGYMWAVVSDAGRHLGGRPVGSDALAVLERQRREAAARA